jgi:flagellar basal body-associated protein FliL
MNKKGDSGDVIFILVIIFVVLFVVALTIFLANAGLKKQCKMESEVMGVEWKYNFWIDCMINVNDKWIKRDNYIINEEKEMIGEEKGK